MNISKKFIFSRVICHIRPELEFLKTNISVLKFGEALYKLTSNEIYLPSDETKATALLHASIFLIYITVYCIKLIKLKHMASIHILLIKKKIVYF